MNSAEPRLDTTRTSLKGQLGPDAVEDLRDGRLQMRPKGAVG